MSTDVDAASLFDGFKTLFMGSHDAVGTEDGGALRQPADALSWWWDHRIYKHLQGGPPCGVYPMVYGQACVARPEGGWETLQAHTGSDEDWFVRWGCVDFDEGDEPSFIHAHNVYLVLQQFEITSWIERSRSKGYHLWVFLDDWCPARLVREALLAACQVVDAPTKEINPKQVELNVGQLGNYIRLPYPGALMEGGGPFPPDRRTMVDPSDGSSIPLAQFVEQAMKTRTRPSQLQPLANLYEPPKRFVAPVLTPPDGDIYKRMSGLAWTVFVDGPKEGMGRGHTLFKLACLLVEGRAHTFDEIVTLCIEADERWGGKFTSRGPGGLHTIEQLVAKASGLR